MPRLPQHFISLALLIFPGFGAVAGTGMDSLSWSQWPGREFIEILSCEMGNQALQLEDQVAWDRTFVARDLGRQGFSDQCRS